MKKVNSLLIGVGYHAKRIYLPYIKNSKYCNLAACWDLMSQQKKIEVFLEGDSDRVNQMIEVCKKGPKHSQIKNVEEKEERFQDFKTFKVLHI